MKYFAKIIKEDNDYIVTFPDFPNVNTFGHTKEEALQNAYDALNGCIESDFERGFKIPNPKVYNDKIYVPISIKPHIELSIMLREIRANKSQIEVANMLGISYQAYQKLENPRKCNPTVKTLERIASIYHKELKVMLA